MPWGVAAAGVASGVIGLIGSSKQSAAVQGASNASIASQQAMYSASRDDLGTFKHAGMDAVQRANALAGGRGTEAFGQEIAQFRANQDAMGRPAEPAALRAEYENGFTASPGYQFRLNEGTRAIQNNAAAAGAAGGGNVLRALVDYGQGTASNEYGAWFNRAQAEYGNEYGRQTQDFTNYYNRLFGLAQTGANAAAGTAQAGVTTGQGIASTLTSAGTAQANITGQAYQGVGTAINQTAQNMRWNALMPQTPQAEIAGAGGMAKTGFTAPVAPSYGVTY